MSSFAAGELDVLVATTVIEVGVDVPNATMMVVWDADKFGISQLHQLRGRIGRGSHPGVCLLITHGDAADPARQRLEAVAATTNGFERSLSNIGSYLRPAEMFQRWATLKSKPAPTLMPTAQSLMSLATIPTCGNTPHQSAIWNT